MVTYHSLHENKIIRYFRGHGDYVTALCTNPHNDTFITSSKDGTFRVWDMRTPNCVVSASIALCDCCRAQHPAAMATTIALWIARC
jgi:WD40 repeat protein